MEPDPVAIVFVTDGPTSSTTEALLLALFATTALWRRGTTATPSGFVPTATVVPVPVVRSIRASVLHPDKVTAARFCTGSMATPAGSGAVEQPVDTSTLCLTVKSEALVTIPESCTSTANRRADVNKAGGTVTVSSRALTKFGKTGVPSRRTTELLVNPLPMIVRFATPSEATLDSVEFTTISLGLVSVMEIGRIGPSNIIDMLSSFWLATTARFVPGSTGTATGPKPVGKGFVRRVSEDGSITERVLFVGFTVTATFVSGLNSATTLPRSAAPVVTLPTCKTSDE